MSTSEYKVQTVWSITSKTIQNIKDREAISIGKFETSLPDAQYSIDLTYYNCYEKFFVNFIYYHKGFSFDDDNYKYNNNVSIKEMNLFISSANFQCDYLKMGREGVGFNRKELLNPKNNYFVDDILKLEVRGILSYRKFEFNPGNVHWLKNRKDFKFIVENQSIMAHKFFIHGISPIFDAALDSGEFQIEDFRLSIVEDAIKLCYGCNTFYYKKYDNNGIMTYKKDDLFDLIKFTNVYDMPCIKEHLENEFESIVNAENVCELANKSLELKAEILRTFCVNFLSTCIRTGTPFNGTLNDLNPEIALLVFESSRCHSQTSYRRHTQLLMELRHRLLPINSSSIRYNCGKKSAAESSNCGFNSGSKLL